MISQPREIRLILHNIRSSHNVGSIFRTADAAGVSRIYLCGYTPAPIDRFGRARKDIAKASLGAEKTVAWESVAEIEDVISKLKREKFSVYALEQSEHSVDYRKVKMAKKFVLILGNEVGGIEKRILDICDAVVEIPMRGKKESLNVAVAAGVALFRIHS